MQESEAETYLYGDRSVKSFCFPTIIISIAVFCLDRNLRFKYSFCWVWGATHTAFYAVRENKSKRANALYPYC